MNPNSLTTYKQIESSGVLSARRLQVYKCVAYFGPISLSKCMDILGLQNNSGRFTELERMDLIEVVDTVTNKRGHTESLYDLTHRTPVKIQTPKPNPIKAALKAIEKLSETRNEADKDELRWMWTIINKMER